MKRKNEWKPEMFKFEGDMTEDGLPYLLRPPDVDLSWEGKHLVSCYQETDSCDFIFPQTDSIPKTLRESIRREWNW